VTKIAVFVATTGGPVQIERVTPERAPQSLVCLSRSSSVLSISPAYDDFVRRGSGVIERDFGPFDDESFRVDVSGQIGSGQSWQLGIYLAHAIVSADGHDLAETVDEANLVLWVTGRVDYDLRVSSVSHVSEKIQASQPAFQNWKNAGKDVRLILPAHENAQSAAAAQSEWQAHIHSAERADEFCDDLGLTGTVKSNPAGNAKNGRLVVAGFAGVILLGGALVVSASTSGPFAEWRDRTLANFGLGSAMIPGPIDQAAVARTTPQVTKRGPKIAILENKPPQGVHCAHVFFGGKKPVTATIGPSSEGAIQDSSLKDVCGLTFQVDLGVTSKYVALALDVQSGKYIKNDLPKTLQGATAVNGKQNWTIDLQRRMRAPFVYNLVTVYGDRPVTKDINWLSSQVNFETAAQKLAESGVRAVRHTHRVAP